MPGPPPIGEDEAAASLTAQIGTGLRAVRREPSVRVLVVLLGAQYIDAMTSSGRFHKVLLIGFDSAVPGRWRRYAEQGHLPVGRRLLAEGAFATACLPAFPTLTTTNWATIATGAWPGTHGVTDFHPHRPGDEIGGSLQGFDARDVTAEFVWEATVRAGMDSSVVNWPGAWPPRRAVAGRRAPRPAAPLQAS